MRAPPGFSAASANRRCAGTRPRAHRRTAPERETAPPHPSRLHGAWQPSWREESWEFLAKPGLWPRDPSEKEENRLKVVQSRVGVDPPDNRASGSWGSLGAALRICGQGRVTAHHLQAPAVDRSRSFASPRTCTARSATSTTTTRRRTSSRSIRPSARARPAAASGGTMIDWDLVGARRNEEPQGRGGAAVAGERTDYRRMQDDLPSSFARKRGVPVDVPLAGPHRGPARVGHRRGGRLGEGGLVRGPALLRLAGVQELPDARRVLFSRYRAYTPCPACGAAIRRFFFCSVCLLLGSVAYCSLCPRRGARWIWNCAEGVACRPRDRRRCIGGLRVWFDRVGRDPRDGDVHAARVGVTVERLGGLRRAISRGSRTPRTAATSTRGGRVGRGPADPRVRAGGGSPSVVLAQQTLAPAIGIAGAWTGTLGVARARGASASSKLPERGSSTRIAPAAAAPYHGAGDAGSRRALGSDGAALEVASHEVPAIRLFCCCCCWTGGGRWPSAAAGLAQRVAVRHTRAGRLVPPARLRHRRGPMGQPHHLPVPGGHGPGRHIRHRVRVPARTATPKGLTARFANGLKLVMTRKGWRGSCGVRYEGTEGWVAVGGRLREAGGLLARAC